MNKVLLISYYFYPCPHTASERVNSWAENFDGWGLRSYVITRNWDFEYKYFADATRPSGTEVIKKKEELYDVIYLPYKSDFREKIAKRFIGTKLHLVFTILNFFYSLLEPYFLLTFNRYYRDVYDKAVEVLKNDSCIESCIISVAPFMQLKLGYLLKKKFQHVQFIADYRDDWGTDEVYTSKGVEYQSIKKAIKTYFRAIEKRWLSRYDAFISVSDHYVDKIGKFLNKKGYTIQNGYIAHNYPDNVFPNKDQFVITYSGSLLASQPIEFFLDAVIRVIKEGLAPKNFRVKFIAILEQRDTLDRIKKKIAGYESYFDLLPRVTKKECIYIQQTSNLLLLVAHKGLKGVPGSKMYEYLALKKPILVCPTDGDIMEQTLKDTNQGFFANNEEECYMLLKELIEISNRGEQLVQQLNTTFIESFERRNLAKKLAGIIQKEKNVS